MQSLPHRTFGTNPQRRGQRITLRLADEDRRGSVQLWRRGCAVDQTHTTPPLSASSSPRPLSAAFPCGVGRSGLDSWWEEIGRAQYRKQKEQIRCCYESLPGRLCRVAVYAVAVVLRDAGGIMWPSPGGVRRTRGRPPVAGTRFPSPPLWGFNNRLFSIDERFPTPVVPCRRRRRFLSLPRPLLPVVALLERSVRPPLPFSLAQQQAASSSTQKQKQHVYASAGGGKAGDCVELVFLRPFCMEGAMSLSLPACRVSCPTQPTLAGAGARHDDASVQCNGKRRRRSRRGRIAACLLLPCVPGRVGLLPVAVCSSLMGKT